MVYTVNIPQASDLISDSQVKIKDNFNQLNTTFGFEHYPFTDATANNGFHNKVTQPLIIGGIHPTTTVNPIIYAMQDSAPIGVLQYSRGPVFTNAAGDPAYVPSPTPITELHSPTTPTNLNASSNLSILDFAGITDAVGELYVMNYSASNNKNFLTVINFIWVSGIPNFYTFQKSANTGGDPIVVNPTGSILRIQNSSISAITKLFWTLRFHRINT